MAAKGGIGAHGELQVGWVDMHLVMLGCVEVSEDLLDIVPILACRGSCTAAFDGTGIENISARACGWLATSGS